MVGDRVDQLGQHRVHAGLPAGGDDLARNGFGEPLDVPGVEEYVVGAVAQLHPGDGLGDHVARGQLGQRVHADHEPLAGRVPQQRTLPAQRLGHQRGCWPRKSGAQVQRGGVELHELQGQVATARPAAPRATPSPVDTEGLVVAE